MDQEVNALAIAREDIIKILMHGDCSPMNEEQRFFYYNHEVRRMGLEPESRPLVWIKLNNKLTLYPDRRAGDMLAVKHNVSTDIVDGPKIIDLGGSKVVYVKVRATMPNGRHVEDVGTVLASTDPANATLKAVTKGTRRATLRICGWGGTSEDEIESIRADVEQVTPALPETTDPNIEDLASKLTADSGHANDIAAVIGLWEDVRYATSDTRIHGIAHRMCRETIVQRGWKKKTEFNRATLAIEKTIADAKAGTQTAAPQLPAVDAVANPTLASVASVTAAPIKVKAEPLASGPQPSPVDQPAPNLWQTGTDPLPRILAERDAAASKPSPIVESTPDPLAGFLVELRAIETPSQCVALARSSKPLIDGLAKVDKKRAWAALVSRCQDVGRADDAEAWLKAELAKPVEAPAPVGVPAPWEAPKAPASAVPDPDEDEERAAIEAEDESDETDDAASPHSAEDNAKLMIAIGKIRESEGGPQRVANSFGVHVTDLPEHLRSDFRESTATYIRGRYPGKVKSLEKALAMLDEAVAARDANGRDERVR